MEWMLFPIGGILLGAIVGSLLEKYVKKHTKTHGVIDVDHNTGQCKVKITSADLSDRKTKKAIFTINHDAKISREEHIL